MQRINRARLDAARFAASETIPLRFADLDTQRHVNNAAVVVLLQEARAHFNRRVGMEGALNGLRVMVAGLQVEYAGELVWPGEVAISTGVLALGRTSMTLAQVARQDGEARVYAEIAVVLADANGPTPLPPTLRAVYERWLIG